MKARGKLFLFAGASGAGKSSIVAAIAARMSTFVMVRKASTRPVRPGDLNEDVYHLPELRNLVGNCRFIIYATNGDWFYGIDVDEIEMILASGKNVLLVSVHDGARRQLEEIFGRENVVEIFIHRDLSDEMKKSLIGRGGKDRLITRQLIYDNLATGLYSPDHVIINSTILLAVEQFRRIANTSKEPPPEIEGGGKKTLHVVLAATGTMRDIIQEAPWTLPGLGKTYCKKDTPSPAEVVTNPLPPGWLQHSLFGRYYRINPRSVISTLEEMGVAFVMYSDVTEARDLQKLVEAEGYRVLLHYLHQSESEVEESVKEFPPKEWKARLEHALMLKKLYEQELILEAHPILLVHGIQSAIDWVQRCILSRPRY